MAKLLVTRGAGFIGSHVVDLFLSKGITGYSHPIHHGPAKLGETRHIYLDAQKAAKELGWTPRLTLEEGLEKTVSHFRDAEIVL